MPEVGGAIASLTAEEGPAEADRDAPVASEAASSVDGRAFRSAVAAGVLGVLADHTRPSRLLGASEGSFLASTLDGVWGVGEQAALSLIVDGKAPDRHQLSQQATAVVVAAANHEVAGLVDEAASYGEDKGIPFLRNLEVEAGWFPGRRPFLEARTIDALFQSAALDHTLFLQAAIGSDMQDATLNLGLGYRYAVPDSAWMLGINAFYDRQFPLGHARMSIGLEASNQAITLFANRYVALSGWEEASQAREERALSGWDIGIAGQVPRLEDLRLSLTAFRWEQEARRDETGLKLMADYDVGPALQLGATFSADDTGDLRAGVRLTYQFGADRFGGGDGEPGWGGDRRLAFVNRENTIRTESRKVPQDYSVSFLAADVNAQNETSLSFQLAGAPPSASFSYTITSSGGGPPVSGTGDVGSDLATIGGIDVSGLSDGTLTLALRVTSQQGAQGPKVTATVVKDTEAVTVATSLVSSGSASGGPLVFRIVFSRAVSGFDLADIELSNGQAANLQTTDNISWTVEVTPAGQGAVEIRIPAAAATGGDNPNTPSDPITVIYDSEAPAGYDVSFLAAPISAAGFALSNAEVGATYHYSIASSGGGLPVTGHGTVAAASQQVTGLDLSGLGDGTLTITVTLTDASGNTGPEATATMSKDSSAPVFLSITPPAPGVFNDL